MDLFGNNNYKKVSDALRAAFEAVGETVSEEFLRKLTRSVGFYEDLTPEQLQNKVAAALIICGKHNAAKNYILQESFIRNRIDYMNRYITSSDNASTSSETDPNSNVASKNTANLEGEVYKSKNRLIQRTCVADKLDELYPGEKLGLKYVNWLNSHKGYTHDESSTPTFKPYCNAITTYPLLMEGVGNIDGTTPTPPNDIQSFSGQITNLAFLISSQCKGAVAFGDYIISLNYYIIQEYGKDWYKKLDAVVSTDICKNKMTVKKMIRKGMKQFIYGVNQPAGNRSYNSPFTNLSFYDRYYFKAMFEDFVYPDFTKPEWEAIDVLQRIFLELHRDLRNLSPLTFPVTTMALLYNENGFKDEEYAQLLADEWSKGSIIFCYLNDSPSALASCCFSGDTKVLWRSSTSGVQLTALKDVYELPTCYKVGLKLFHNGSWVDGRFIKLPNQPMYKVTTFNNKEYVMTDNHINVTLRGEVPTSELTDNDYLLFSTSSLPAVSDYDAGLTYDQGLLVGACLGSGVIGGSDGDLTDIRFILEGKVADRLVDRINIGIHDCGDVYNTTTVEHEDDIYRCSIKSAKTVEFISKWTDWGFNAHTFDKKLDLGVLLQSEEFRHGILEGLCAASGYNDRCCVFSSVLADHIEVLATSLGLQSVIETDGEGIYNIQFHAVGTQYFGESEDKSWIKDNNSLYHRIKSIEKVEYTDEVYCLEMENELEPYFTLPSGLITHNCRVQNEISENTFSSTTGMTGVMTGSCNVITINLNRLVQDFCKQYHSRSYTEEWKAAFKDYMIKELDPIYKYHIAYKTILYDMEDYKMFAGSNGNYIHINKLYSTIGMLGYFEAAKFMGMETTPNDTYFDFLQLLFGTVREQNKAHNIRSPKRPFLFNTEAIPGESLAVKFYEWDKQDGYMVPSDQNLYNSYFYSPWDGTNVLDKLKLHGRKVNMYTDGGQACHLNLSAWPSADQCRRLMEAARKEGTNYFTINVPISVCKKCGKVVNAPIKKCDCGSEDIQYWVRIIGYPTPVDHWADPRQKEFLKRIYGDINF